MLYRTLIFPWHTIYLSALRQPGRKSSVTSWQ